MQQLPVAKWLYVAVSSHCRSPGLISPRGAKYWQQSKLLFRQSAIISQERKLTSFDIVNPLLTSNGDRGRMSNFVFWGAGSVLFVSGCGWQWHGAKSCLGPAEIQSNVFGGHNDCLQHIFIQILGKCIVIFTSVA